MHELRGRAGVHAQLIHDRDGSGGHDVRSPRSRSEATQIALRPSSRISRATARRFPEAPIDVNLISIGRLTPVITSTLSISRNVIPRFDGVPPNMSVSTSTPSSPRTRSIACAMSSRASFTSSCQPIETAVNFGRSPTIISAALTSSFASCPCVTTTTPITTAYRRPGGGGRRDLFPGQIAVPHADARDAEVCQRGAQPLRDPDGTVPSARAADPHREVALALRDVERDDVAEVLLEAVHELARGDIPLEILGDGAVAAGPPPQRRHEVRVRQAADVEQQIGVH